MKKNSKLSDRFFNNTVTANKERYQSYYDKTEWQHLWLLIRYEAIIIFTLGLGYPWAVVLKYKSLYHHKVICGKRLKFIGDPIEFMNHWIWWWLLSVVTVGLYGVIANLRLEEWITANTIFEEVEEIQEETPQYDHKLHLKMLPEKIPEYLFE